MPETIDLTPILNSLHLPRYRQQIEEAWEKEQTERHRFWKEVDENKKAEFINGIGLYDSPVYGRHWMASSNLLTVLLPFVKEHRLGKVGAEKVMIRCTRNDYEPDICFWRKEVANTFSSEQSAFPPPAFVVEILFKSTEARNRGIKFEDYALHGVEEYWIVDVENACIEQYFLEGDSFKMHLKADSGEVKSTVIVGFEVKVLSVFEE